MHLWGTACFFILDHSSKNNHRGHEISCQGGSWSRRRSRQPNENLMLIGTDRHRAPLQGFKTRPDIKPMSRSLEPKVRSLAAFIDSVTRLCTFARKNARPYEIKKKPCEHEIDGGKNLEKRSKQAQNCAPPSPPLAVRPYQQNSWRRLILHAAPYPPRRT